MSALGGELGRQRRGWDGREVRERAVRDHVDARGLDADLRHEAPPGGLRMRHDPVEASQHVPLRRAPRRRALALEHVVGGEHERPPTRQERLVDRGHREPLEVHEVGGGRRRPQAQHVGHMLGELEGAPQS